MALPLPKLVLDIISGNHSISLKIHAAMNPVTITADSGYSVTIRVKHGFIFLKVAETSQEILAFPRII